MVFKASYTLANKMCNGLGWLLDCSNSNDKSIYVPLLRGQAAILNVIETGRANSANTMDLAAIINPVQQSLVLTTDPGRRPENTVRSHEDRASCQGSMHTCKISGFIQS